MLSSWEYVLQHGPAVRAAEQSFHVMRPLPSKCKLEYNEKLNTVLQIHVQQLPQ